MQELHGWSRKMFFPQTPDFVAELLDVSVPTLILGKRVDGYGGNGQLHRYLNRLRNNEGMRTSRRKLHEFVAAMAARHPALKLPFLRSDQVKDAQDLNAWQAFAIGRQLDVAWPRTTKLVNQFVKSSRRIELKFETGQYADAVQDLRGLPWASTKTVGWYVSECERDPRNAARASFPLKLLGLFVALRALGAEQRRPGDNQPGLLTPLMTSRDPLNGELVALRIWFDQLQEALGGPSLDEVFNFILRDYGSDDETRIRQGRRYRSGTESPSVDRLHAMMENARPNLKEDDFLEFRCMGEFACFLHKGLMRCKIVAEEFDGFDPMNPFNDYNFLSDISIDEMWSLAV